MTGLGQSLRDPHSLIIGGNTWGNLPGSCCDGVRQGGAEMLFTRQQSPRVNLRQFLQEGAWNILTVREDDHLSLLSSELHHLNIRIAALSEARRPNSGDIMVGGYNYD